jgi:hypothetical protein
MLCGMATFKRHCGLGFWKGSLIHDAKGNPPLLNDEGVKVAPARKNNVEWIAEGKSRHWKYQK